MNYRNEARSHLCCAEKELAAGDDDRLKYAAVELRMSMEAITFDRALAYKDEFPPAEYDTWQPAKVMAVLLEIDPMADKDRSLRYAEEKQGKLTAPMKSAGSEIVLNMSALQEHYHALGSYLHIRSIKQARAGKSMDFARVRTRLDQLAATLRAVLSSKTYNITLGNFSTLDCIQCGKPVRKRIPAGQNEVRAKCNECQASYVLIDKQNGQVEWISQRRELECGNIGCKHKIAVWLYELERGRWWTCLQCGGQNTLDLRVVHEPGASSGETTEVEQRS